MKNSSIGFVLRDSIRSERRHARRSSKNREHRRNKRSGRGAKKKKKIVDTNRIVLLTFLRLLFLHILFNTSLQTNWSNWCAITIYLHLTESLCSPVRRRRRAAEGAERFQRRKLCAVSGQPELRCQREMKSCRLRVYQLHYMTYRRQRKEIDFLSPFFHVWVWAAHWHSININHRRRVCTLACAPNQRRELRLIALKLMHALNGDAYALINSSLSICCVSPVIRWFNRASQGTILNHRSNLNPFVDSLAHMAHHSCDEK